MKGEINMKKLLSIMLAALMLLAIAAPALATEPTAEPTTKPTAEPTTKPTAEPTTKPTTAPVQNEIIFKVTTPTEEVVANTEVVFNFAYDLPKFEDLKLDTNVIGENLKISASWINLKEIKSVQLIGIDENGKETVISENFVAAEGNNGVTFTTNDKEEKVGFSFVPEWDSSYIIRVTGVTLAKAKTSATATLSFGDKNLEDGAITADGKYTIKKEVVTVAEAPVEGEATKDETEAPAVSYVDYILTEFVATKEGETPANPNTIVFRGTEAEGKKSIVCTDVFVNGYELQCKALGDEVEFQFVKGEEVLTEGEAFTALKAAYDGFMKYMGFTIGNFELNDTLFLAKVAAFAVTSTATVGEPDGGDKPPQTGDVASIMGYVMLAVGAVPAGFAIFRKRK